LGDEGFQPLPSPVGIGRVILEAHRGTLAVTKNKMDEVWQMTLLLGQQLAIQYELEEVLRVRRPL
jgi:hypothetical protein